MELTCLARQDFDSQAFGLDYYRMVRFDADALAGELTSLRAPYMADAKLPAQDIAGAKSLMAMGFRKVCVQPTYVLDLSGAAGVAAGEPSEQAELLPEELDAHAANFPFSRFGLDHLVTDAQRIAHQRKWIGNSMSSRGVLKFLEPGAFVSFKVRDGAAMIDLISVLPHARGRGSLLLGRLNAWAASRSLTRVEVTTESENVPACLFYQKNAYRLERAAVAFHLLQQE